MLVGVCVLDSFLFPASVFCFPTNARTYLSPPCTSSPRWHPGALAAMLSSRHGQEIPGEGKNGIDVEVSLLQSGRWKKKFKKMKGDSFSIKMVVKLWPNKEQCLLKDTRLDGDLPDSSLYLSLLLTSSGRGSVYSFHCSLVYCCTGTEKL